MIVRRVDQLERPWSELHGMRAINAISFATSGDHQVAHEYHEIVAANCARKAAHAAFRERPELRG